MHTFYIPDIKLEILNKKNTIGKLKNNLLFHECTEQHILTLNGIYKIINDEIIKYKIVHKEYYIIQDFLDKYSLLFTKKLLIKDKNVQYNIPYNHSVHTFIRIYFNHSK